MLRFLVLCRTCVWQKLPEGWLEFHDRVSQQPYYYNPTTRQKTWARPVEQAADEAVKVTATRLMSMEQPKSCLPSLNKRRSGSLTANQPSNSSSSALSGKETATPLLSPTGGVAAADVPASLEAAAARLQQQAAAAVPQAAAVQPTAGS
jgi:hypothetical protein